MSWQVRDNVLVRFKSDAALLHHRVVVKVNPGPIYTLLTPDRAEHQSRLIVGGKLNAVIGWDGTKLPAGVKKKDIYLDTVYTFARWEVYKEGD